MKDYDFHLMSFASREAYKQAVKAMDKGDFSTAIKIVDKVIKTEKHKDHLYNLLGRACMGEGRYVKASNAFEKLLDKYSSDIDILSMHAAACIESHKYKKAINSAAAGYLLDKYNISIICSLADGYIHTCEYSKAADVLEKAMNNPFNKDSYFNICVRLSYVLYLDKQFDESLEYMKRLLKYRASDEDKISAGELFMSQLDYLLDNQMYREADCYIDVIMQILPDREDIAEFKKIIERILQLEPEFCRFEEDRSIPDGIVSLIVAELFPGSATDMTEEQKQAYTFVNEYSILQDCTSYLMSLRYMKNKYPGLYELKKSFFDTLQEAKKRKVLRIKYQARIYQYQDVFEELVEEMDEETYEEIREDNTDALSNIRPFVRNTGKTGANDLCPCGSGKKYGKCCGKK